MKRILPLLLALVLCLSLCACGDGNKQNNNEITQEMNNTSETNSVSVIVYDHTLKHPLVDSLYGEWVSDFNTSMFVMPIKIVFSEDGTCSVEYPEESYSDGYNRPTEYKWGIVPDCVEIDSDLYVRIGVEDDLWYLFYLRLNSSNEIQGFIAVHSIDPVEGGILIDGFTEDGYAGMMFDMKKAEA